MKRLKENRAASFIAVTAVYVLAVLTGIHVYTCLMLPWWLRLLIADIFATLVTFVFSIVFSNASVYDPYWSVQPPVILIALAIEHGANALGILLVTVISLWAIRLTLNWAYTFQGLSHQDWRYTMLRERTGALYPLVNLFGIHIVPTLVVYGCTLPAAYAIVEGAPLSPLSIPFLLLSVVATVLQGAADVQMHVYRRNRTGAFIRSGLWKYSRHPNYLGEILMWWGVSLSVLFSMPDTWYLSLGAVANTALFLFISIPMADARQARKAGFEEYKASTRMLLPLRK